MSEIVLKVKKNDTCNYLKVFISSPKDVENDKIKLVEFLNEFNKNTKTNHNIKIKYLDWEKDTNKGTGRPQGKINKLVKTCDLYIGLLGKSFGSHTGLVKSGTYEEFLCAYHENEDKGRPEMRFYFKKIQENNLKSKEIKEFKKIKEFKENIRNNFFYDEYADISNIINDLKVLIGDMIKKLPSIKNFTATPFKENGNNAIRFDFKVEKAFLPIIITRSLRDGSEITYYPNNKPSGNWKDSIVKYEYKYTLSASNKYGTVKEEIEVLFQ